MKLKDKVRSLRQKEGERRGLQRAMTQGELARALGEELGRSLSQSYLSQIESGARPHLSNTSRLLLARFFRVHPGYLVDEPEGYHAEPLRQVRLAQDTQDTLDRWLAEGAERFREDPKLSRALLALAGHDDTRACLLLLHGLLKDFRPFGRLKRAPGVTQKESVPARPRRASQKTASSPSATHSFPASAHKGL